MLKNLKITTRLAATLGLMSLLILGLSVAALLQMGAMRAATHEITGNWLPSVEYVNAMNTSTSDFRVVELRHVLSTLPEDMAQMEKELAAVKAEFDKSHDAYVKLISSDEERKLYESFAADWKTYLGLHAQLLDASRKNETERARTMLEKDSQPVFMRLSKTLDQLVSLNHEGSVRDSQKADGAYVTARNVMFGGVVIALSVALAAGLWLMRSIAGPLGMAVRAADRVAQGDFTETIHADGEDEAAQVLKALHRMQANLSRVVADVRANSESVATASSQIAQGNHDLSQRTEEQASALQQTAATMEELNATVRNNADSAKQANQLALGASNVAAEGGEVVGRVVSTMQDISESSRKISDIIGVIDGIAFQTNILALNAAVEAARAGEQGRGFAVVAGEVRTLAQRSAEAAKEIKSLIGRSVEQVEQGGTLVEQAGKTMGEIVTAIRRVTDIVGEIASASVEQSSGISQVGDAISQMDQVTQQNAALVEESAAAAESLRTQAHSLVQAVATFKLAGTPTAALAPRAVAAPTSPKPAAKPVPPVPGRAAAAKPGAAKATAVAAPRAPAQPVAAPARPAPAPATTAPDDDWTSF